MVSWSTAFADEASERKFTLQVPVILVDQCFGRHGSDPDGLQGGYAVSRWECLLPGGGSEDVAVVSGKPGKGACWMQLPGLAWRCLPKRTAGSTIGRFDPKPELTRLPQTEWKSTCYLANEFKFFVGSPYTFNRVGQSGIEMCDQWKYMANPQVADELCNFRECQAESMNQPEAVFHMNAGRPGWGRSGDWVVDDSWPGLLNQYPPGYVVMSELAFSQMRLTNWSNGFLPAHFQGTRLRPEGSPIPGLQSHATAFGSSRSRCPDGKLRIAYRVQTEVPGFIDIADRNTSTKCTGSITKKRRRSDAGA